MWSLLGSYVTHVLHATGISDVKVSGFVELQKGKWYTSKIKLCLSLSLPIIGRWSGGVEWRYAATLSIQCQGSIWTPHQKVWVSATRAASVEDLTPMSHFLTKSCSIRFLGTSYRFAFIPNERWFSNLFECRRKTIVFDCPRVLSGDMR